MSGSKTEPRIAVLAIVEPDSEENTVPPTIDTIERRPGTREIILSMAPIALNATPVCSKISPISKNRAIGASPKFIALLNSIAINTNPISPLINKKVPKTFAAKKAKATGKPRNIATQTVPSINNRAKYHSMIKTLPRNFYHF